MSDDLIRQIKTSLAQFSSHTRLYAFTIDDRFGTPGVNDLVVEAFTADDAVQDVGRRDVIIVSTNARLPLESLLGQQGTLAISLANGHRMQFSGDITEAEALGSIRGLGRYRLRLSPWLWRLRQQRNCRVWQDTSIIDIIDSVFKVYLPLAQWCWSEEVRHFMHDAVPRTYCCQYRESDLGFVQRLLTEEGLGWRVEQSDDGPCVVMFADSRHPRAIPEDPGSAVDGGIRFHRAYACERQDTVQDLQYSRTLIPSLSTVLAYDDTSKRVIAASAPSHLRQGRRLPVIESFDDPGQYAYTTVDQARHYANLQMERHEARSEVWNGSSTLRSLQSGTRLRILDTQLKRLGPAPAFTVLRVLSIGVNNLPVSAQDALAELFGPVSVMLREIPHDNEPTEFALAFEKARQSGYANCFDAIKNEVIWRPQLLDSDGNDPIRPTVPGSQTAIVVGADGSSEASGPDELHCDRLGRVRIRFHWQDAGTSCWVRVAQRSAGGGMGIHFLPRIGTEVLVKFIEGNIDRPIIVGALYNGQGEGGAAPTPGGKHRRETDATVFTVAHDHARAAQGNLAGGNSPVWHGASADYPGHRNGGAQWGLRSKEFGGWGYNQLLFDDTDARGRVQLKTTHAATELNLGHLIHAADNYRGSFRGTGAELRTDAYGAVRAGAGLLITSYNISHNAGYRDPAGENAAAIAMLKHATQLGEAFSAAAVNHHTVALAAHIGTYAKNASVLNATAPPLKALLTAVSGMVDKRNIDNAKADAAEKLTTGSDEKVPHTSDPIIAVSAEAGLGVEAGQSLQLANGETVSVLSGGDTQFVTGGQMRMHTGQAIGVLGGAEKAGETNVGLQMTAAKDANVFQALRDAITIQARDEVDVISANAHIDWAAAKRISISTAGGANITIDGGNITVQCPGKITVHAGKTSLTGPAKLDYPLPVLPREICIECLLKALKSGSALSLK